MGQEDIILRRLESSCPFLTTMSQLANEETGRGFTHRVAISLDSYNGVSGNDDQTVTLFTSDGGFVVEAVAITSKGSPTDLGTLGVKVGDGSDDDGLAVVGDIDSNDDGYLAAYNNGAYFNDGTTANTVNGKSYAASGTITATLTTNASNWYAGNGATIIILMDIKEIKRFV